MTDQKKHLATHFAPAERVSPAELLRETRLVHQHAHIEIVANAMPNGVLILNQLRQAVYSNRTFMKFAGVDDPEQLLGKRPGEILHCKNATGSGGCGTSLFCQSCGAVRAILSSLKGEEDIQECVIEPEGSHPDLHLRVWANPVTIKEERFSIFAVEDMELEIHNRELTEKLQEMVSRDPLTMLHNRRYLLNEVEREFARSNRYQPQHPLSLMMLDIDHFKQVNDTYGHDAGDTVLMGMAEVLRRVTRKMDLPVRYGGEEFVVMMPEAGPMEALQVSERLRVAIENEVFILNGDRVSVTVSIGTTGIYKEIDVNIEELIKQADTALYRAKAAGRNCVQMWDGTLDGDAAEKGKPSPRYLAADDLLDQQDCQSTDHQ